MRRKCKRNYGLKQLAHQHMSQIGLSMETAPPLHSNCGLVASRTLETKIFGQQAVVLKPEIHRDKLDEKGRLMNFVGYTENFQTFRFFNPQTSTIDISCDAIFSDQIGPIKTSFLGTDEIINRQINFSFDHSNKSKASDEPILNQDKECEIDLNATPKCQSEIDSDLDVQKNGEIESMSETLRQADESIQNMDDFIEHYQEKAHKDESQIDRKSSTDSQSTASDESTDKQFRTPSTSVKQVTSSFNCSLADDAGRSFYESKHAMPHTSTPDASPSNDRRGEQSPTPEETQDRKLRKNRRLDYKSLASGKTDLSALIAQETTSLPYTFAEAMSRPDWARWKQTTDDEIRAMLENEVFDVVICPKDTNVVGCRWVFKENGRWY